MNSKQTTAKVTLKLNEQWAGNLSKDQVTDYIKVKLQTAMGFRARVESVKLS